MLATAAECRPLGLAGNPEGADKPNKKVYDPRMPVRSAAECTVERLVQCFEDLNRVNIF